MRKHLGKLVVGLAVAALAMPALAGVIRKWEVTTTSTSPFTGTVPTADCDFKASGISTLGLNLVDCSGYYVCIAAAAGQTLSGAGTLEAYFFEEEPGESEQMRERGADEILDSEASGEKEHCFSQRALQPGSVGCGFWNPVGVTTSGGTTVKTFARCIQ
jgi:hypothetical protein